MAKIPFKVSARTAKLIGLENFSNEEGAIVELVKNTYDADARNCILIFDLQFDKVVLVDDETEEILNKENSCIYIIDNGVGMTDSIIRNQWMTIGTDDKLYQHLTKKGRVKTGAKGIGRFALNRLGLNTELFTISKETNLGYSWKVDWEDFDKANTTVSQVKADLETVTGLNLKNEIYSKFNHISGLKDLLKITTFNSGTIIKISDLSDDWEYDQLEKLFRNLEMLLPPKEQSDFDIHFYSTSQIENFGKVKSAYYDDFDYKIKASYLNDENKTLTLKVTRRELDVDALENRYKEVFDYKDMKEYPYRLKDFKSKTITINSSLNTLLPANVEKGLIDKIGKFGFTFYYLKNTISDDKKDDDLKKYPYNSFNSSNRKAWLKRFGGVKIFRDDFRVRPYGENGEDWLKLGERQAKSPGGAGQKMGGYRIRPNQIAGTINISRIHNQSFQDKSGREGIRENEVFDLFKNILEEIISLFEKDRNTIMFHLSQLHKEREKEEEAKRKAQEAADRINNEQEDEEESSDGKDEHSNSKPSEAEKSLALGYKILTEELEEKEEEIRLLRNLASVGLVISSFAHEVKSLRSRLIPRTTHLVTELKNHLNEKKLKKNLDKDDNPFYMIQLIQQEDAKLKHWLDYSLNTLKRDKRERSNLDFKDYFEKFKSTWSNALKQRNIKLILKGEKNESHIIRAFEVDMDSIFNNLLSNSLNALKGKNDNQKTIKISWKKIKENIEVLFFDNGKGLDKKYHNNPEEIFKLLETSKRDKTGKKIGTGLGLYIVKSIIEEYNNSTISIIKFQNGLSLKITFKTRK